jgi:hypothetical protein
MSSYTYIVDTAGNATFRVQPAKRPFFQFWLRMWLLGAMAAYGLLFGLVGLTDYRSAAKAAFFGIGALILALAIAFHIFRSRSAWYRKPVSFVVNPSSITMNGQEVSLDRVNDIEIRNAMDGAFRLETGAIYAGAGGLGMAAASAMAAAHAGAQAMDAAYLRAIAQRSFFVVLQYGGSEAVVAGGLTLPTARGLIADMDRAARRELR